MSSFGNAVERWSMKNAGGIAGLMRPVTSDDYPDSISPAKSISTIVDSAYSSFSGSSYVPDYQTASFQSDSYNLNDDQLSYMDSEYVKAIYNPSTVDHEELYHDIYSVDGPSNNHLGYRISRGSKLLSDEPPISSTKLSSYVTPQSIHQSNENYSYDDRVSQQVKWNPPSDFILSVHDHKAASHELHWQTRVKEGVHGEVSKDYNPSQKREQKENHYFSRSSYDPQLDGMSKMQDGFCMDNSLCDFEIQEQINTKSSTPPQFSDNGNCTYEVKHFSHMNKINKEMHIQTRTEEELEIYKFNDPTENYTKQGEKITCFENTNSSLSEFGPERLSVYETKGGCWIMKPSNEIHCYSSEGTMNEEAGELAHDQQHTAQKQPLSQSINTESSIRNKPLHTRASQIFYCGPHEDLFTQSSRTVDHENEIQEGTKTQNLRKDATRKSLPLLSKPLEQEKSKNHSLYELTSEKITKATTPMLYHLAGGRQFQSNANLSKPQQDNNPESKAYQRVTRFSVSQPTDVKLDSIPLQKNKSQSHLDDHIGKYCGDDISSENLTASAEECLMHDYREKLKVAQKKVLRATSFKRKDLQMSLPGRIKLNPPKRPSIDHFRSYSLSSANDETKSVQVKSSVDTISKKEETEKPVVSRIGGRKRITKEQRKLCYSEPEKLDHLGIVNSVLSWKEETADSTKNVRKYSVGMENRKKSLDSKERTLSSSNLSKIELKQIQHNALIEYMERKTNQRPNTNQQVSMSGTRDFHEWNCASSETLGNDIPLKYLSRRSTGASSSYDGTVTWNDKLVKHSALGDSVQSLDPYVRAKCMNYLDQCTAEDNRKYLEKSPPSVCHKQSKSTQLGQVYNGSVYFSALAPCSDHLHSRLTVTEDNAATETERVCTVRGRGKSMEEIGTSDIIRLSVLSQSTDELHHIKGSVVLPRPENVNNTAVVPQDKLQARNENESGKLPRKTRKEDFLGPHGSDIPSSALERHSRPVSVNVVSSNTDNCSYIPSTSEIHPGAPEQSQPQGAEDEVFLQVSTTKMEMHPRTGLIPQEDASKPQAKGEEAASSLNDIPCHTQTEEEIENEPGLSIPSLEKDLPEHGNEVGTETSVIVGKAPVSEADNQDLGAENKETKLAETRSIGNPQWDEFCHIQSSQVNTLDYIQTSQSPSDLGKHDGCEETPELESMASDPEKENDLPTVKLKSPDSQRRAELVKEITAKDKSLVDILKPLPVRESAMELMKSLFPVDVSAVQKARDRGKASEINQIDKKDGVNTSKVAPKTVLLFQKDYTQEPNGECSDDINSKKRELISSITSKLEDLCGQRESLLCDINENLRHGKDMEAVVKGVCKPNEYERYMMFIGDLEKVVSLLFSLSMRLARVENALSKIDDSTDAEETQSLKERHSILSRQREDAKDLKENLDRRERVVTGILAKYLSEHQLQDYKHFVSLKTSFLIEQKDLDEKIKFHEEQLESLHNSIPP
ncbi:protein Shroom1 isoform 2-T2 [Discoglossus pictus]